MAIQRLDSGAGIKTVTDWYTRSRFALGVINVIFVFAALMLIIIGFMIRGIALQFDEFISGTMFTGSWIAAVTFIVLGFFMFLLSAYGIMSAAFPFYCIITSYTFLMAVVFILQLSATVIVTTYSSKVNIQIENGMYDALKNYTMNPNYKKTWDDVQSGFRCCGVDNPLEWIYILNLNSTLLNLTGFPYKWMPESCCGYVMTNNCTILNVPTERNQGCYKKFRPYIDGHLLVMEIIGLCVIVLQPVCMMFALRVLRGPIMTKIIYRRRVIPRFKPYQLSQSTPMSL